MDKLKTTNTLLLFLAIPLVFYLMNIMSFIFIPLVFSMFISLLFLPMMRKLKKMGVRKTFSISIVAAVMVFIIFIGVQVIKLSSQQIRSVDDDFIEMAETKIVSLVRTIDEAVGLDLNSNESISKQLITKFSVMTKVGPTLSFVNRTVTMFLMTLFFSLLWLADSIDIEKILRKVMGQNRYASIKTFMKIERDLIKFIKVKVIISLFTGIGTGLVCYFFGVSFPVFWGLFAFLINFVQMVGSFIAVITVGLFGIIELDMDSVWLFYLLGLTLVQVVFGAVLEPIFMGKSFSINVITVLVMLMFWGFIWGIPGMILSIPLTVFIKIILEQFPRTKFMAEILSGKPQVVPIVRKRLEERELEERELEDNFD